MGFALSPRALAQKVSFRKSTLALALAVLSGIALAVALLSTPPYEVRLSSYTTPLKGRMKSQRYNALLALDRVNGVVLKPGDEFSFNNAVRTWSRDMGYKKAPVSFNGQLIRAYGGGVCQASTTVYNAVLLAGLEIKERHRHRFVPGYAPPGRDAAVAYSNIDLRFRNPHPWEVRIAARIENERLLCEVFGRGVPDESVSIRQELRDVRRPTVLLQRSDSPHGRLQNPGKSGYSVATYRVFSGPRGERRELLSEDVYPEMHRVIERPGGEVGKIARR